MQASLSSHGSEILLKEPDVNIRNLDVVFDGNEEVLEEEIVKETQENLQAEGQACRGEGAGQRSASKPRGT